MGFGCGGGITCKAALKKFEESTGTRAAECPEIRLIGVACFYFFLWSYMYKGFFQVYPPIEKMDSSLAQLQCCVKLSLSTNMIVNIQTTIHTMSLFMVKTHVQQMSVLLCYALSCVDSVWPILTCFTFFPFQLVITKDFFLKVHVSRVRTLKT